MAGGARAVSNPLAARAPADPYPVGMQTVYLTDPARTGPWAGVRAHSLVIGRGSPPSSWCPNWFTKPSRLVTDDAYGLSRRITFRPRDSHVCTAWRRPATHLFR